MAEQVRTFTKGDLLRVPRAFLKNPDGSALDLTGQTVTFRMVNTSTGAEKIAGATAVIINATTGEVKYNWVAADVDTVGDYWAWFIRVSGGLTEHFPAGRGFKIRIVDKV